jgi:hypothetical protein
MKFYLKKKNKQECHVGEKGKDIDRGGKKDTERAQE